MIIRQWLLFLSLFCFALFAKADVIWLKNGDRLSGRIESMDNNSLLIVLGKRTELVVNWEDIKTFRCSTVLWITTATFGEEKPTTFREAMPGMVLMDDNNLLALSEIKTINRQTSLSREFLWEGNFDVNVHSKREDELTSDFLKTSIDTRLRTYNWRHKVVGSTEYEMKNSAKSVDKYAAEYSIDRLLDEDWFLRLDGAYKRDRVSDLWLETNWGAGPGYRFWDNSISRFEITALFSQYYYRQHWADTIDAAWEVNGGELGWDWKQEVLASTLEFYSFGTIYKPQRSKVELIINDKVISDEIIDIDYGLETEWGVRYRLTQYVNASAKVILDYLKGVDISQQKRYYEFGIGFEW